MRTILPQSFERPFAINSATAVLALLALLAGCADRTPVSPSRHVSTTSELTMGSTAGENGALATLRRASARYHNLEAAKADGFVFLHGCEVRPDEGPVGIVYVHMGRLLDGVVDPSLPDGLIYEPRSGESPRLVGVELAVPYPLWTQQQPPSFLGTAFQSEDEFGVFGLHVWLWRNSPEGLFAESNANVSCGAE